LLATLHTFSLLGIDALSVDAEVDVSPGAIPKTIRVRLPELTREVRIAAFASILPIRREINCNIRRPPAT
jgi:hypothetical protein